LKLKIFVEAIPHSSYAFKDHLERLISDLDAISFVMLVCYFLNIVLFCVIVSLHSSDFFTDLSIFPSHLLSDYNSELIFPNNIPFGSDLISTPYFRVFLNVVKDYLTFFLSIVYSDSFPDKVKKFINFLPSAT